MAPGFNFVHVWIVGVTAVVSGGGSVHPLESQYDSQVSTVSNTPDTSHTDHVTDFNNKFRFGFIKMKISAAS